MTRTPFYIEATFDGPSGTYDVCATSVPSPTDDGPDEVIFNGTLEECRAEYPGAPLRR
jgi:hypothetical protein